MGGKPQSITEEKAHVLKELCRMRTSLKDCAIILKVSTRTVEDHIKRYHGITFTEYAHNCMAPVRHMIVKNLVKLCEQNNLGALIFCAKNLCGWADKIDHELGVSQQTIEDIVHLAKKKQEEKNNKNIVVIDKPKGNKNEQKTSANSDE